MKNRSNQNIEEIDRFHIILDWGKWSEDKSINDINESIEEYILWLLEHRPSLQNLCLYCKKDIKQIILNHIDEIQLYNKWEEWISTRNRDKDFSKQVSQFYEWILEKDIEKSIQTKIDKEVLRDIILSYENVSKLLSFISDIKKIISPHIETLYKKRAWMRLEDDYGFVDDSKWNNELDYYIKKSDLLYKLNYAPIEIEKKVLIAPTDFKSTKLMIKNKKWLDCMVILTKKEIETLIIDYNGKEDYSIYYNDIGQISGNEYEKYCAEQFIKSGWEVRHTQASNDQGIDLLARSNNIVLAVQCKNHSKPVGNKAVQEAFAGGMFYNANRYLVIAPNGFTNSAKELASKLKVKLINHNEIDSILY